MTLTATDRQHSLQWRAFVGPPFRRNDAEDFWDWSDLDYGDAYTPISDTTLSSDITSASTELTLASDTGFPDEGGCWVGPRDVYGGTFEYLTYTGKSSTTLTGLVHETVDAEQTGAHPGGSLVRFWWPLNTNDGTLTLSESTDTTLGWVEWQAELQGVNIPQAALRNGHLVLIQTREATTSGYSSWTNELVGWLKNPQAREDASTVANWRVTVVGSNGILDSIRAKGLRVGPLNTALGGQTAGSTALAASYKETHDGEFIGSNLDLSTAQAVDGSLDTLYISERYLGTENKPSAQFAISEVHIAPYIGQGKGYRWVQVTVKKVIAWPNEIHLINQDGYSPVIGTGSLSLDNDALLVFCENAALFRAENPASQADVLEVSDALMDMGYIDSGMSQNPLGSAGAYTVADWWDSLAPSGGALYYTAHYGGSYALRNGVIWGDLDQGDVESVWGGYVFSDTPINTDENVAAPAAGQTLRRLWSGDGTAAADWLVDYVSNPGTFIGDDHRFFLQVGANGMGLTLTDDITDASPGADDTLYISLGDAASVDGLDASGTLQIGSEQITYSAKTAANDGVVVTARGANSTVAAAHVAGEVIYQVESGVATDALPLSKIVISRPATKPALADFKLYASRQLVAPDVPDEDEPSDPDDDLSWSQDYDLLATVASNTDAVYTYTHSGSPTRYRWFLLVCTAMDSTDPYRLMVNEFKVEAAGSVFSAVSYLATGTVWAAAAAILAGCGIPTGARGDGGSTPTVIDYTTAPDMARDVLADLADMTSCLCEVRRDSKLVIRKHPYFSDGTATENAWTKTSAASFAPDWAWGRRVGQIELTWQSLDGTASGTVKYPATPDAFGDVLRVGPLRVVDAAAALTAAELRYWLVRIPFGATIEAAGAPVALRPLQHLDVTWELDDTMLPMERTYLVGSVDHRLQRMSLATVVHGLQIEREDER